MDPTDLSDDQLDQLAQQLAGRLPTGTHGDRVVLSRRQFALAASGVLSAGALMALGVDEASAQAAAGQVGTSSSPVDAFAYDLNVANAVTSSLPMNGNDIENAGSVSTDTLGHDLADRSDVSASRSFGETYQNNENYTKLVFIQVVNNSGSTGQMDLGIQVANSDTNLSGQNTQDRILGVELDNNGKYMLGPAIVPPGAYYTSFNFGAGDLDVWVEGGYV